MRVVEIAGGAIGKAGHKHFMAKEIAEQPSTVGDTLAHYLAGDDVRLPVAAMKGRRDPRHSSGAGGGGALDWAGVARVTIVACGTAHLAGLTAKYWFERIARLPVEVDIASEFRYREPPLPGGSLAVFVSQSGETADTLAALRYARAQGAIIAAVVNVPESSIAREADLVLPTLAGVEIGVASTKAFTSQLVVLLAMAIAAGRDRGTFAAPQVAEAVQALRQLPGLMNHVLGLNGAIRTVAGALAEARDVLFLGRGAMFPMALEGALKLKEISYIHAEGYAGGELKHGPIALVERSVPVVVLAPHDRLYDKTRSNLSEVMARQGPVVLVSDAEGQAGVDDVWHRIEMPAAPELIAPILYALPMQMLAYHTADAKGTDVDQPRNLAKSVTVE